MVVPVVQDLGELSLTQRYTIAVDCRSEAWSRLCLTSNKRLFLIVAEAGLQTGLDPLALRKVESIHFRPPWINGELHDCREGVMKARDPVCIVC